MKTYDNEMHGPARDNDRKDGAEEYEIKSIAAKFGVPEQLIREAIHVVGSSPAEILKYLQTNRGYDNGG